MNDIIANYKNSKVLDLTGAIFEYDLNYFRLGSEVIKQGKRTGVTASLHNLPIAATNVSGKVAMGYYDTGLPDANGCSKLWYCEGDSDGITCYNQGYLTSNCDPSNPNPTGSDSGYDSSGAYQSGGGPYAGNTSAQNITVDPSITNNPKLNCINGKLVDNTVYNDFLKKFKDNSTYNLTIKAAPINSGDLGVTTYDPYLQNGNVAITINANEVDMAFSIDLAATFIHEAFHAYIAQDLIQRNLVGTEVYNQTYANTFDKYITAQVDNIMASNPTFNPQNVSHEIIAAKIDMVANGVKQYAEKAWPALKTDPSITMDNYRAIAWGSKGLVASKSYENEFNTAEKLKTLNETRNATYQSTSRDCSY